MPFVPSSQRLNTNTSTQIQVTEAINPIPTTQQQMINEDPETNNSQNSYENNNNNNNNNNNDLEDLLLTVLDELDTVKSFLQEQGIVSQHQKNKPQPTTETLVNKYGIAKELPSKPPQVLPNRNAHDFSNCF